MNVFHFFAGFVAGVIVFLLFLWVVQQDKELPQVKWIDRLSQQPLRLMLVSAGFGLLVGGLFSLNEVFFGEYVYCMDFLAVLLLANALYDLVFRLIPLLLLIILLVSVLLGACFSFFPLEFLESLLGAAVVGGLVGLMYFVTRGRGIGEADVFVAVIIGLLFGWERGLIVFSAANTLGLIVILPLIAVLGKKRMKQIPLVFFLVLAIFLEWYSHYTDLVLDFLRLPS